MSDREIRALERLAAEGSVADAVALLRARVRAGLVPQNCVDLAARLGDEVAGACATPCLAPMAWGHVSRVEALSALPSRVALGLALDWAAAALPIWEAAFDDGRPRSALSAARALVAAPSATTRDAARAAALEAHAAAESARRLDESAADAASAAASCAGAAEWAEGVEASACGAARVGEWCVTAATDGVAASAAQRRGTIRALLAQRAP